MCRFKSAIITCEETYHLHDVDSHEEILRYFNLPDDPDVIVRVELVPPDPARPFGPLKNWLYNTDQNYVPSWFSEDFARAELIRVAMATLQARTLEERTVPAYYPELAPGRWWLRGAAGARLAGPSPYAIYQYDHSNTIAYAECHIILNDASGHIGDRSDVVASDHSHVALRERGFARIRDHAEATAWGYSHVVASQQSSVKAYNNAQVDASGDTTVELHGETICRRPHPCGRTIVSSQAIYICGHDLYYSSFYSGHQAELVVQTFAPEQE